LQRHLATNPLLLVQHLGGGGGRWMLSQKRLGSEYVPDFVIGERSSGGFGGSSSSYRALRRGCSYRAQVGLAPNSTRASVRFRSGAAGPTATATTRVARDHATSWVSLMLRARIPVCSS
jgi:hypothetical protein